MTASTLLSTVVALSLATLGVVSAFFIAAPALGFPLEYNDLLPILSPVLPVFAGSAAMVIHLINRNDGALQRPVAPLFVAALTAPFAVFLACFAALVWSYAYSSRPQAPPDTGMSKETLHSVLALLLTIVTGTTNSGVALLVKR